MNYPNWTQIERLIYQQLVEDVFFFDFEKQPSQYSIGDFGEPRKNGEQLKATVKQVVAAAKKVLHPVTHQYLKGVKTWPQLERAYRDMGYAAPPLGAADMSFLEFPEEIKASGNGLKPVADFGTYRTKQRELPKKNEVGWKNWHFCPFCWRLIPQPKRSRQGRCTIHEQINSAATQRARRRKHYIPPLDLGEPNYGQRTAFIIEYNKVRKHTENTIKYFPNTFNNEAYDRAYSPDEFFDPIRIPIEKQNLHDIWVSFNNTAQYAHKYGANLNNFLSVIKTIDDKYDPTGMREKVHIAFSRAPSLARGMLLMSETWLRLKNQERRGGGGKSRKGKTGGWMPGAGRPPKHSQ